MNRAKGHAIGTGAKEITLSTAVDNLSAQGLYQFLGYIREDDFYTYNLSF